MMLTLMGILMVLIMVFGGFILAGGKILIILHSLPHEMIIIGGATIGAFIIGNKSHVIKASLKALAQCFKSSHWSQDDYKDLLCLLFALTKVIKTKGLLTMEAHIDNPADSTIFSQYPKITHDHFAIELICDSIRTWTMGMEDPYHMEDMLQRKIDKHHHELEAVTGALQTAADGLPAIGIVAAVLGVIKTMASIDQPPEILGHMIGGALVGTFLGVFLSYCFIGPIATKVKALNEQDGYFYLVIRDVLVAHLKGHAPQISVETGRGNIPTLYQPTFSQLETAINEVKV
jgi:chemotaxis protein MotA